MAVLERSVWLTVKMKKGYLMFNKNQNETYYPIGLFQLCTAIHKPTSSRSVQHCASDLIRRSALRFTFISPSLLRRAVCVMIMLLLSFAQNAADAAFHGQSSITGNSNIVEQGQFGGRTLYSSFSSPVRRDHWRVFLYSRIAPIDPIQQHVCFGSPLQSGVNGTFAAVAPPFGRPLTCRWQVSVKSGKNIEFHFDQQRNPFRLPSVSSADDFGNDKRLRSGLPKRLRLLNNNRHNEMMTMSSAAASTSSTSDHCLREWIAIYDGNELAAESNNKLRSSGGNYINSVCMPTNAKPKARLCADAAEIPESVVLESNSAVVEVCSNTRLSQQNSAMPPLRFGVPLLASEPHSQSILVGAPSSTSPLIRVTWAVNEELFLERVCNKIYTENHARTGVIMSPGFGVRNYPDNIASCDYEFVAEPGMVVEFSTEAFNLEEPTSNGLCTFDRVTVLEKFATGQFEPVAAFCGSIGPEQLLTTHPHVKVRFRTDSTYNERGFVIKWKLVSAPQKTLECGRSAVLPILAQAHQMRQLLPGPLLAPIVGGVEARPYSWPWQVGILTKGTNKVFCGAALIAPQWIVSAAHCFYPGLPGQLKQYEVRIGEHDLLKYEGTELRMSIDRVIMNPKFDPDTVDSDISLIRLEHPVPIRSDDDSKRFICLPPRKRKLKPGTVCYIVGWGEITAMDGNIRDQQHQHQQLQQAVAGFVMPADAVGFGSNNTDANLDPLLAVKSFEKIERHRLRQAPVPILPQKICKGFFPDAITANMFCAGYRDGGVDACQGDSGGPLVCMGENGAFEITGVTSWGFGCAQPKLPGVYTNTAHYVDWIQDVISKNG